MRIGDQGLDTFATVQILNEFIGCATPREDRASNLAVLVKYLGGGDSSTQVRHSCSCAV